MSGHNVYISSALLEVEYAFDVGYELHKFDIHHISQWVYKERTGSRVDPDTEEERSKLLAENVRDIERAQACIFLANVGAPRAGHWDAAYALALRLPLIWVHGEDGHGRSLWDSHAGVIRVVAAGDVAGTAHRIATAVRRNVAPRPKMVSCGGGKA